MPPLKGIDRGLNGDALKALEESGHESRIVIVDPSYPFPDNARVVDYQGDSSAQALRGILKLVPHEPGGMHGMDVDCMDSDYGQEKAGSTADFEAVAEEFGLTISYRSRRSSSSFIKGFYDEADDPERRTLFVRTRDEKAYACAMFVVGHSQIPGPELISESHERGIDESRYAQFTDMQRFVDEYPGYSVYALGHLWSQIMIRTGVRDWGGVQTPLEERGKVTINGEKLEIIRVGEHYRDTSRPLVIQQTIGLSMNLETLRLMLDTGALKGIDNIGPKTIRLVTDFLASQAKTGDQ